MGLRPKPITSIRKITRVISYILSYHTFQTQYEVVLLQKV